MENLNLDLSEKFNVAYIKLVTNTEGPYKRCCIWFQGCDIKCPGCANKKLQELKPNHITTLDKLIEIIRDSKDKYGIEGVTLSGGEPTIQKNLGLLCSEIRKLGLGIIMFTGRNIDSLDTTLVNLIDLIIDGPFIESELDNDRILLGSKNKGLHFITNRYKSMKNYFYNKVSVEEIEVSNEIFINGD